MGEEAEGRGSGWGEVDRNNQSFRLGDEQRLDWLRLIRSQNVGPRGIMAQIPEAF
jgi:hypothetical protein